MGADVCYWCELTSQDADNELTGGHWVIKPLGLRIWVKDGNKQGRAKKPQKWHWDTAAARKAHAAHVRGERTPWVIEGERVYQRNRKRRSRGAA